MFSRKVTRVSKYRIDTLQISINTGLLICNILNAWLLKVTAISTELFESTDDYKIMSKVVS